MKIYSETNIPVDPPIKISIEMTADEWRTIRELYWYTSSLPDKIANENGLSSAERLLISNYMKEMYEIINDRV